MSDKQPRPVRKMPRRTDPRSSRSHAALGQALVELAVERPYQTITVQDILDRAGVARSTFYAHYRNKSDVLYSSVEGMLDHFGALLDRSPQREWPRLFQVAEFLEHIGSERQLAARLAGGRELDGLWALTEGYVARTIRKRVRLNGLSFRGFEPAQQSIGVAMLAGALMTMIRDWQAGTMARDWQDGTRATPRELDAAFHRLAYLWLIPPPTGPGARTKTID